MRAILKFKDYLRSLTIKGVDKLPGTESLSKKLIAVILTVNGVASLFVTVTTVLIDYKFETDRINDTVAMIKSSNLDSISLGVWNYDELLIRLQAEGMLHYKYLKRIRVLESNGHIRLYGISEMIKPLLYSLVLPSASKNSSVSPGVVELAFDSTKLYFDLCKKFSVVLLTQCFKALVVSFILFYIFNLILIGPIVSASKNLLSFSPENFIYKPIEAKERGSELDSLFGIVNTLVEKNIYTHHQLSKINEDLEFIISERTVVIQKQEKALADEYRLASIGRVAGGIAHEINTPLSAALLKLSMLKSKVSDVEESNGVLDSIDKISQILNRITIIINNVKALNRDASNEEFSDIAIMDILDQALTICREVIVLKNIQVFFNESDMRSVFIRAKPVQLGQIIVNLFRNSIDALEQIEERWIRIRVEVFENVAKISFSDSGKGIEVGLSNKIFDPYFTTKDQGKGSGLGLSLSRKMILDMNGKLYLDTNKSNTTFVIEVPTAGRKC